MPKCDFNKVALLIEIALRQRCSPVSVLHIFRTPFPRNTAGWLLLNALSRIIFRSNIEQNRQHSNSL